MGNFDYLTSTEFRQSLENDYAEMRKAFEGKSWKSVQVLAGSIVEALLVDYLVATQKTPSRPTTDPLKIELADAIKICTDEKILSERTAALCTVIRSYRNLIHPGRIVRLKEPPPDEGSATIAVTLVDMITEDVAKILRQTMGLTAEQIMSKILRDPNALTILPHLLADTTDVQKERLLVDVIPKQHDETQDPGSFWTQDDMPRLEKAYRMTLDTCNDEIKKKVAMQFVSVLKDSDGGRVMRYGRAFFSAHDMAFLPELHRRMIVDHLLALPDSIHTLATLARIRGIQDFLEPKDVAKWLDPYLLTLFSSTAKDTVKERARSQLSFACALAPETLNEAIDRRLNDWLVHFERQKFAEKASALREFTKEIQDNRLPF